jgi:predicted DNA-binding protein (MmcQ/YjbR family)
MPYSRGLKTPELPALKRLRKLCLALPETSEVNSWGHPNFRAGRRTFVTFEWIKGRPSIAFRLEREDIGSLLKRKRFFLTPYGRGQWVSIWIDGPINWGLIRKLVIRSYRVGTKKRRAGRLLKDLP